MSILFTCCHISVCPGSGCCRRSWSGNAAKAGSGSCSTSAAGPRGTRAVLFDGISSTGVLPLSIVISSLATDWQSTSVTQTVQARMMCIYILCIFGVCRCQMSLPQATSGCVLSVKESSRECTQIRCFWVAARHASLQPGYLLDR